MSKTINRAYLKRLIEQGKIEMISSYHFDDHYGSESLKKTMPVRIGVYGDMKEGFCNLYESDLRSSCGRAYENPDGTIHLSVHSNCFYDFRRKDGTAVKTQADPSFTVSDDYRAQVRAFADKVDAQTAMRLIAQGYGSQIESNRVKVTFGKKFARVDVGGSSGRYMVDREGEIFGVKAYGVVNLGHHYGNLDSIEQWNWGDYRASKTRAA